MPVVHSVNIKDLNLSDFPQFNCLCELCDCGCFERGRNVHSEKCKKKDKKKQLLPFSLDSKDNSFKTHSLYQDTFVKFDLKSLRPNNRLEPIISHSQPEFSIRSSPAHLEGKKNNIKFGETGDKIASDTTTKEHFKAWGSRKADIIPPYPELAESVIYPSNKHVFNTTNEQMFRKNYGNFRAKPNLQNQFEGTFKINQGKMNLDSTYRKDFPKFADEIINSHEKHVTRQQAETDHLFRRDSKYVPMFLETQNMADYTNKYEDTLRSVWIPKKVPGAKNLFQSGLHVHLQHEKESAPIASSYDDHFNKFQNGQQFPLIGRRTSSLNSSLPDSPIRRSAFSNESAKNIRYVTSFDNTQIPSLRIIDRIPSKFSVMPDILKTKNKKKEDSASTYQKDFARQGVDICMAKAYKIVSAKNKPDTSFNQFQAPTLIAIKE